MESNFTQPLDVPGFS